MTKSRISGAPLSKIGLSSEAIRAHTQYVHGSLGSPHSKRHLDRFSRFSTAHGYVHQSQRERERERETTEHR